MRIALIKATLWAIVFGTFLFLSACTVMPMHGTVVTRVGSPYTPYGTTYYNFKEVRIHIREDEFGLVSFRVSEGNLHGVQVDWVLRRVEYLKSHCKKGGVMKKYEINTVEHTTLYSASRPIQGNTTVNIEYMCNRSQDDKAPPRLAPK